MIKYLFVTFFLFGWLNYSNAQTVYIQLQTNKGNIILQLADETPKHRDAFVKNVNKGLFKNVQFNRVIQNFVSQGGELDSPILALEKAHPEIPPIRIPAEFNKRLFHQKGALGMGRDDNAAKGSYINQIYLVQGKIQTEETLAAIELKKGIKFSTEQRHLYKTIGGTPNLDHDYTIFGIIIKGIDVADTINSSTTDKNDLPIDPIIFSAYVLSKNEISKLTQR